MQTIAKYLLAIGAFLAVPAWGATFVAAEQKGDVIYVLEAAPNQVIRYDVDAGAWLPPLPLTSVEAPTGLAVHQSGVFVSFDRYVSRIAMDGSGAAHVVNTSATIGDVDLLGDTLVVFHGSGLLTVDAMTFALLDSAAPRGRCVGTSPAPSLSRILCRSSGVSPSDILYLEFDSAGNFVAEGDSPHHGAYPNASNTWVFPEESRVVDSAGSIYDANTLRFLGSMAGAFDQLVFVSDVPVLARGSALVSYSNALLQSGTVTLPRAPTVLGKTDTAVVALFATALGYDVATISLGDFSSAQPGAPIDPSGLPFMPDDIEIDTADGIVYLLSRLHVNVFRWSIDQQRYLGSIPLTAMPAFMSLDADADILYLADPDGRIKRLPLDTLIEEHIATLPQTPLGMAQVGSFVFAVDESGAWESHYTISPSGQIVSAVEWNYFSTEYIWSAANSRIYFFRDNTSPNDLLWETIDPATGSIGTSLDSPYHSSDGILHPIRVAPDGSVVVLGSGRIYDAVTLTQVNSLSSNIVDATWVAGALHTIRSVSGRIEVTEWSPTYAPWARLSLVGTPLRIFGVADRFLVLRAVGGVPRFDLIDFDDLPDQDADGAHDYIDNCPAASNPAQDDLDLDTLGDLCDPDIDGDALPNDYETDIGADPLNAADAALDFDGDGFDNVFEYSKSTDPNDPLSLPIALESLVLDFEDGVLPNYLRPAGNTSSWTIAAGVSANGGARSLMATSADIADDPMISWRDVFAQGTLEMDVLVGGTSGDRAYVLVDGVVQSILYGYGGTWQHVSLTLQPGVHVVQLQLENASTPEGSVWFDNIEFAAPQAPDTDADGAADAADNCVWVANADQADDDGDGHGNVCDNCIALANGGQLDSDSDFFGDVCDADFNGDGVVNVPDMVVLRISMGVPALPGSPYSAYDLNADGWINVPDLVAFKALFGKPPGPSGYVR